MKTKDKSKKGSYDKAILPLINLINKTPGYRTTSSCSGRILLISLPESGKKYEAEWIYTTHTKAKLNDITKALKNLPNAPVWLRFESFILHIGCETIEHAKKLLAIKEKAKLKKGSIITLNDKNIVVEIVGTEYMSAPIAKEGKLIVNEDYIKFLVDEANKKMESNKEKIIVFSEEFRRRIQ